MLRAQVRVVPVKDLVPNPRNVRLNLEDIDELANSIRVKGLLQPLIVNELPDGRLMITDGHRRHRACLRACVPAVPCIVTQGATRVDVATTMLASAMHRQLRPIEQAKAFKALRDQGVSTSEIARATGYRQALIHSRLLLLDLPIEAQLMVEDKTLSIADATSLAKQVRSMRTGSARTSTPKARHFHKSHPLARDVAQRCTHHDSRVVIGAVGCGPCWEAVIREDEHAKAPARVD